MGCDIHISVEGRRLGGQWFDVMKPWEPRHYGLFGEMAKGIRGRGSEYAFKPRGFPENAAYGTISAYGLMIIREGQAEEATVNDWVEGAVLRSEADRWVDEGLSVWINDYMISHPDHHSPSWLDIREFEMAILSVERAEDEVQPEYAAIKAYMYALENRGYETRLVFWFDN